MGFKARQHPAAIENLLAGKESRAVAFVPSAEALGEVDLVAFANAEQGGTILIGVETLAKPGGGTSASVVGCRGGVTERRKLQKLAKQCVPPVQVALSEYKYDSKPVFRLDVAPSQSRPHCTSDGRYAIREDDRNAPLTPDKLDAMLAATREEPEADGDIQQLVHSALEDVLAEVGSLPKRMRKTFDSAERNLDEISTRLEQKIDELTEAVDASAEDSFLNIGLTTIRQAQKIGFQSLEGRLDQNAHLLLKIIRRMGLYRMLMQPVKPVAPAGRPPVVLVQLGPDFADEVDAEEELAEAPGADEELTEASSEDTGE